MCHLVPFSRLALPEAQEHPLLDHDGIYCPAVHRFARRGPTPRRVEVFVVEVGSVPHECYGQH